MGGLLQDVGYGLRTLRRNPAFFAAAVLSLGLGIGANTTIFTVGNALLSGELPGVDSRGLVTLHRANNVNIASNHSLPNYLDLRTENEVFAGLAAYFPTVAANLGGEEPERIWGQLASDNFFAVLGVQAAHGRTFLPEEDHTPGGNPVVVLSHTLWQRRFGGDRGLVGKTVVLNNRDFTVVGISPQGFRGPFSPALPDFWAPLGMQDAMLPQMLTLTRNRRNNNWLYLVGRLRSEITAEQAQASLAVLGERLEQRTQEEAPDRASPARAEQERRRLTIEPAANFSPMLRRSLSRFLAVVFVVVGLVLLIACANVANLLLARGFSRQREIGIRRSLGARRGRIIRQLLTESILLASAGGAVGMLLAFWSADALSGVELPIPLPLEFDFSPDLRVLGFNLALAMGSVLLFGLIPAYRVTRPDPLAAMRDEGVGAGRLPRFSLRNGLVVAQITFSLILLIGTGLFLRSLQNAHSIDAGFRAEDLLLLSFDPTVQGHSTARMADFLSAVQDRVVALPGARSAAFTQVVPLSMASYTDRLEAGSGETARTVNVDQFLVSPGFFQTMDIALLRGRDFLRSETADPLPAVINQTLAERLWPDEDSLGLAFRFNDKNYQIIGVAAPSKSQTIGEDPRPILYRSLLHEQAVTLTGFTLLTRTDIEPTRLAPLVREQIRQLDANLPVYDVKTMNEHLRQAMLLPRLAATLFGIVGLIGLSLASAGLFGVMHYAVSRRTREIGIRMALGAHARSILRTVVGQALTLALIGVAIGLAGAFALSRVLASALYDVSPTDPLTFAVVPVTLLFVAAAASYLPARRAANVRPIVALRYE